MYMKFMDKRASALSGYIQLTPRIALTLKFILPSWKNITAAVPIEHSKVFGRLAHKVKKCLEKRPELQELADDLKEDVNVKTATLHKKLMDQYDQLIEQKKSAAKQAVPNVEPKPETRSPTKLFAFKKEGANPGEVENPFVVSICRTIKAHPQAAAELAKCAESFKKASEVT